MSEPPVVSALIETFTSMLADKVLEEVSLITDFKHDFEFICDELFSVKSLLDEAGQHSTSRSISNWLEKLEYFLIDAVDMVDECRASSFGNSIFSNFEKLIFRYKMGRRIRTLRQRIHHIHGSAKYLKHLMSIFQINALNVHKLEDKRERSSAPLKESHIVGIKGDISEITKLLLTEDGPQVIAVVGMGGIGKTLLVQSVFKSQKVQESFDHVVWLAVSQNFDLQPLIHQIARKMKFPRPKNQNLTTEEASVRDSPVDEIKSRIIEDLEKRSCLFVVDGLWKNDFYKIEWLSAGKTKIVVTTRQVSVANNMQSRPQVHIKIMSKLSPKDSIQLFCLYAFPDSGDTQKSIEDTDICLPDQYPKEVTQNSAANGNIAFPNQVPKNLTSLAEQIVQKCDGLPLALKTIGASLARVRMLPNDWESILKSLNEAQAMNDQVWPSLRLSYQALPYHLKLCFDYCSCFPKNTPIKSEFLVNAWIDEGFIPRTAEYPYDVGLSYINELIDRCLLEVSKFGGDGRVRYCKMHDLLHELAHLESHKKTKCLLKPGNELNEFPVGDSVGLRRISLIENNIEEITQPIKCPGLRSLLLWKNVCLQKISEGFFENMKYLAVLDLSKTSITLLPETVGQLRHLKLLNLSQTKITKLPKSLAGLRSLQFLDVSQCQDLREMHSGIGEHKAMIHLNVKGSDNLESLPVGISKLTYLHTLKGPIFKREKSYTAKALQWRAELKRGKRVNAKALQWWDLKRLTHLQHLSLTLEATSSEDIRLEEGTFGSMTNMRFLSFKYINSESSGSVLKLPMDIEVMHRLEILHLKGCVAQDWIFGLQNLMELELHGDNGSTPDYIRLRSIPNLRKLKLSSNDKCVEFPQEFGEHGAFPKLEYFVIKHFNSLQNFPSLDDGAFPMLKSFQMKYCKRLKDITRALQKRTSLEEIRVKECPEWEDGIWKDKHTWKLLKDRPIKLIINGYTISWALDQFNNSKYRLHFKEREKLRRSLLICKTAVLFMESGTSSAAGVVEQTTLQNDSENMQEFLQGNKFRSHWNLQKCLINVGLQPKTSPQDLSIVGMLETLNALCDQILKIKLKTGLIH